MIFFAKAFLNALRLIILLLLYNEYEQLLMSEMTVLIDRETFITQTCCSPKASKVRFKQNFDNCHVN